MPVRKVSNRGGNIVGYFPSIKMHKMISFESTIERDYILLLDWWPHIVSFDEQPVTIEYNRKDRPQNKIFHYTPDFRVIDTNNLVTFIECKPLALVDKEDNKLKAEAAKTWCQANNYDFKIVTDKDLRSDHLLTNIKLLTQFARHNINPEVTRELYSYLRRNKGSATVAELLTHIKVFPPPLTVLLHQLYYHKLTAELINSPLNEDTSVFLLNFDK